MAIATTSITEVVNNGGGTWKDYGSGGGSVSNTNVFITSTGSRARKISNGVKGFAFDLGASGTDISADFVSVRWAVLAGVGALDFRINGGVQLVVEDTSGNESYWYIDGVNTYSGGWKVSVVDMNQTPTANNGTAATLTAARYIGIIWDETASVGGGDPNCYIDQILRWPDSGVVITGNSTTLIDDLVDTIDNPTNGPYGLFERRGGIVFTKAGTLVLQPDASDMSASDSTLVWEVPVYTGVSNSTKPTIKTAGLTCSDTDAVTFTRCSLTGAEADESVNASADCLTHLTISSATDFTLDTCNMTGWKGQNNGVAALLLGGSGQSITNCQFTNCQRMTHTGAVIRGCAFRETAAINTLDRGQYEYDENADIADCEFVGVGTGTNGWGLKFNHNSSTDLTGVNAIDLDNIVFTGFGADDTNFSGIKMVPDTTTIDVDFNVLNGGTVTTIDTTTPDAYTGVATIAATVAVKVTVQEADATKIQDARVRLEAAPGGDLPSDDVVTITTSGTTASVSHTAHGLSAGDFVIIRGANESELTGRKSITNVTTNAYDYTITSIGGASGTGTITSTSSILSAFTDVNGVVEDTGFNYTSDQPVRGVSRKGETAPFYKQSPITGTITSGGLDVTVTMTPDA